MGPKELELIRASGWRRFPPRLPDQPNFYPVTNREYARLIARDWNVRASGAGYVTQFDVRTEYLAQYETHVVGGREHEEYWIPADRLEEFNQCIVGSISVVDEFEGGDVGSAPIES